MKALILSNNTKVMAPILYNFYANDVDILIINDIEHTQSFIYNYRYDALFIDFTSSFEDDELLSFVLNTENDYPALAMIGIGIDNPKRELEYFSCFGIHEYIKINTDPEIIYLRLKNILKLRGSLYE